MDDALIPLFAIISLFIGMPWIILHYVTKWRQAPRITAEDEQLLDELHFTARRLEERLGTIERIIAADDPDFRLRATTSQSALSTEYDDFRKGK